MRVRLSAPPTSMHKEKSADLKMKLLYLLVVSLVYFTLDVLCDEVKSKRAFYDTPYGQIHYKYGGDFTSVDPSVVCYTFLLFHGNPRSVDEFTELVNELGKRFTSVRNNSAKFSFIAMDLLGEGHSDDPVVDSDNGYVSMEEYTEFMIDITGIVFKTTSLALPSDDITRYIVPLGSLTGSAIAAELSYQLTSQNPTHSFCKTGNCKVLTTILHDPMYYFSDQIVANVHSYASQQRAWKPSEDGQHLIEIWNNLNYQPYKDLALQDRKSLDRYRAATTQWQVILSYADYSSEYLLGRLKALSKLNSSDSSGAVLPLVIIYGGEFMSDPMTEKVFEVQKMRSIIADATKGGLYETVVEGGNQALLSQNVTIVADIIMKQISEARTSDSVYTKVS